MDHTSGLIVLKSVSVTSYAAGADMSMRDPSQSATGTATNADLVRFGNRVQVESNGVLADPATLSVRSVELVTEEEYIRSCEATAQP